jgi:hypothetical protein
MSERGAKDEECGQNGASPQDLHCNLDAARPVERPGSGANRRYRINQLDGPLFRPREPYDLSEAGNDGHAINYPQHNWSRTFERLKRRQETKSAEPRNDEQKNHCNDSRGDAHASSYFQGNASPEIRSNASMYFDRVWSTTSGGRAGGGLFLSQPLSMSQSRTNCLSNEG